MRIIEKYVVNYKLVIPNGVFLFPFVLELEPRLELALGLLLVRRVVGCAVFQPGPSVVAGVVAVAAQSQVEFLGAESIPVG